MEAVGENGRWSESATVSSNGVPVRALRTHMGTKKPGQQTGDLPQVQEPVLGQAEARDQSQDQVANGGSPSPLHKIGASQPPEESTHATA